MQHLKSFASIGIAFALLLATQAPALAQPAPAAATLVIGVDHADPANQRPDQNRLIEYTDFFTRAVTVHTGDVLDFRAAPGTFHIIGLGPDDAAARSAYPLAKFDSEDSVKAVGSGMAKLELGPSNFSVTGGSTAGGGTIGTDPNALPVCGVVQLKQPVCTFKGGTDVEIAGPLPGFDLTVPPSPTGLPALAANDWKIQITAPAGSKYAYLCFIHSGMTGTVTVVAAGQPATTQAQVDADSATQFAADQAAALAAEAAANKVQFTGGDPGSRIYQVSLGASSPDNHAAVLAMLPKTLPNLLPGDRVEYAWLSPNEAHTVSFPTDSQDLPSPFGFDCGATYQSPPNRPNGPPAPGAAPFQPCLEPGAKGPEWVADPGNAASGTALSDPTQLVDSGVLIGTKFGLVTTTQKWSVVVNSATKAGTYNYQCTLHDWMHGSFVVAAAPAAVAPAAAPTPAAVQVPAKLPPTGAGGGAGLLWGLVIALGLLIVGLGGRRLLAHRG